MSLGAWPIEKTRKLVSLWSQGKSVSHIRVALGGLSRNSVIGKAYRLGLRGRFFSPKTASEIEIIAQKCDPNRRWTQQEDNELRVLASRRFTAGEISADMGISRARVTLRAKRLGIVIVHIKRMRTSYVRLELRGQKKQRVPDNGLMGDPAAIFAGMGMSLLMAGSQHCRWPLDGHGQDGMPRCCGDQTIGDGSYCADHARKAYRDDPKEAA